MAESHRSYASIPPRHSHSAPKFVPRKPAASSAPVATAPRFVHDFGRIPIFNALDDVHEQEAERVSERVVHAPAQRPASIARGPASSLPPPAIRQVLASPGQPLDRATGKLMEARLGYDFSDVRLHADSRSAMSAKAIGARAYTVGTDIVFASGEFAPASAEGRRLLAHELTHVVQQRQGGIALQRQPNRPGVGATLIDVNELRQAGVKVAPESQSISTPKLVDRQVEVLDDDLSQTHRMPESQVRNSPEYVDNGLASVGAELENIFTLDVKSLVFRYQGGRELKIPPDATAVSIHKILRSFAGVGAC